MTNLSVLMGGRSIQDEDLESIGVTIVEKDSDGDRKLEIPSESVSSYLDLVRTGLTPGFWTEVVGEREIEFIFKFRNGAIKEYTLTPENESEIAELCSEFNGDPLEKTANVYSYIAGNSFYKDFMRRHYGARM